MPLKKTEAAEVVKIVEAEKLPDDFWNLGAFQSKQGLKDIHTAVVQRLQMESPDADTLELMMMERVCFLYIFMRASETPTEDAEGPSFDRNYKDMMSLWVSMAADLRKQRLRLEETQGIRASIVGEVSRALKEALKGVDPQVAQAVQGKLITLVAV